MRMISIINSSGFNYLSLIAQADNTFVTLIHKSMYGREIISSLTNLCSEINCHLDHLLSNNRTSSQLGQQDTSFLLLRVLFLFTNIFLSFSLSLSLVLSLSFSLFLFLYLHFFFSVVEQTLVDHQRTHIHTFSSYIRSLLN